MNEANIDQEQKRSKKHSKFGIASVVCIITILIKTICVFYAAYFNNKSENFDSQSIKSITIELFLFLGIMLILLVLHFVFNNGV